MPFLLSHSWWSVVYSSFNVEQPFYIVLSSLSLRPSHLKLQLHTGLVRCHCFIHNKSIACLGSNSSRRSSHINVWLFEGLPGWLVVCCYFNEWPYTHRGLVKLKALYKSPVTLDHKRNSFFSAPWTVGEHIVCTSQAEGGLGASVNLLVKYLWAWARVKTFLEYGQLPPIPEACTLFSPQGQHLHLSDISSLNVKP